MSEPTPAIGNLQIEQQIERLQLIADPVARSAATDLVASVLELHGVALQKMLAILQQSNSSETAALAAFERDDLIRAVLLLHDLHSQPLAARVNQAVTELQPRVQKFGAALELIEAGPNVRAVVRGGGSGCGSTAEMLRSMVEAAIVGAAPDAAEIAVEIAGDPASDKTFVTIDSIQPVSAARTNL